MDKGGAVGLSEGREAKSKPGHITQHMFIWKMISTPLRYLITSGTRCLFVLHGVNKITYLVHPIYVKLFCADDVPAKDLGLEICR